jgi:hypothetical protein
VQALEVQLDGAWFQLRRLHDALGQLVELNRAMAQELLSAGVEVIARQKQFVYAHACLSLAS